MTDPKRLKILRVVIGLNQGGVQQAVLNLFKGLDKRRFEPIACAIENTGAIGKEIEAAGFEVITLGYKRQPWRTIYALAKLMRDRKIDIVHASSYHPSLYARIAGLLASVPVLISHEHTVFDRKRQQRTLLNRFLSRFTDAYVAVGRAVAEQVTVWYRYQPNKVQVIYNGVDTLCFHPPANKAEAKRRLGFDPDRPVAGMISRLDPLKGYGFFFDAVRHLQAYHDVQWLVVGMGRGEQEVRREASERGLENVVQFLGMRRDIPELLAAFDIYVLPTLKEGLSNSILEAMAAGCAVVVSDYPANLEVVSDGVNGLVVPMRDSVTLTQRIEALLEDTELRERLGAAARRHIEENFSVEQNAEKTAALYERLWKMKKGAS